MEPATGTGAMLRWKRPSRSPTSRSVRPEITIAVGGTVTWTNTDNQAHTATSSGNFDTGSIDPDATASVTFDEPGTYTYICSFHPFMTGTVTVV